MNDWAAQAGTAFPTTRRARERRPHPTCDSTLVSRLPNIELIELISLAFLAGQIDHRKAEAAYLWLLATLTTQGSTYVI